MNTRIAVHLYADDPIIITASSASSDQGEALRYIPGATLWGALAARIYEKFNDTWDAFHSGALKITNAYPVLGGAVAWPVPLCLHHEKGKPALLDEAVCAASSQFHENSQPIQFRGGFINTSSNIIQNPQMQDAVKTAINPDTGAAAEAQLFGSEAISAGQSFVFWLEGPENLVKAARDGLGQQCFLGRSRFAEFGKSSLSEVSLPDWPKGMPITNGTAYVWTISDLCLSDEFGQPELNPTRLDGAASGNIDYAHSSLRFRTYWPYNAKWKARALARQVIEQGSVFCLRGATGTTGFSWIGEENASGCGLIYVSDQPPLQVLDDLAIFAVREQAISVAQENSRLAAWLQKQVAQNIARDAAMETAQDLSQVILTMIKRGRAHPSNQTTGPTKTQLNKLRSALANRSDGWMVKLWGKDDKPGKDSAWGFRVANPQDENLIPFYQWVKDEVSVRTESTDHINTLIKALELAAKQIDDTQVKR